MSANRRHVLLRMALVCVVMVICLATTHRMLSVAYHRWRMQVAYGSLFSNPQPIGNGLAAFDVAATDVDAAVASYERHRQALVELGSLAHIQTVFPMLATDGTERRLDERSAFVHRMWKDFPDHRHYCLAADGTFESWVPVHDEQLWRQFLDGEARSLGLAAE